MIRVLDPIIPLSISIAEGKGTYAFFLGSGISKSAGIPTGKEIFDDAIKHIYKLENETSDISDGGEIDRWFKSSRYKDFTYSKILEMLCPSQEDRRKFLEKYFEGRNPSESHKIIANFVKQDFIKVIITTNFDQLMEKALDEEGVQYDVVSSEEDLDRVKPREHSSCRIFKVHGDYKKLNILNTEKELEKYSPSIAKELQEIFNRYGLVVVGYSGTDKAAVEIFQKRYPKYTLFWVSREGVNETINEIIKQPEGRIIVRDSADLFFKELERKINLFLTYPTGDTPEFLAAQIKSLLKKNDVIEINEISKEIIQDLVNGWEDISTNYRNDHQNRLKHLKTLETTLDRLLVIGFVLIEYGENEHYNKLLRHLETINGLPENLSGSGSTSVYDIPRTLLLELFYLWGMFSLHIENFTALKYLFDYQIYVRDRLVPLFAYSNMHYPKTLKGNASMAFDYMAKYPEEREYFGNVFSDFLRGYKDLLCQFNLITALEIAKLNESEENDYTFYANFGRYYGGRIRPLILKLKYHKEFALTFVKYLFDEDLEDFRSKLNDRYNYIREKFWDPGAFSWDSMENFDS